MEKYFVYLLLVSSAGYTRGAGPTLTKMTCDNCVEKISGELNPKYPKPICDGNYSKSIAQYSAFSHCLTVNKTIISDAPSYGDKAIILDRLIGDSRFSCSMLLEGTNIHNCSECFKPRCNYPLPKATDADMIECYQCEDKGNFLAPPCDMENITNSKTSVRDGRVYSCYTITMYDFIDPDIVVNYDRFSFEKDFCEELKLNAKYADAPPDCTECTESRCNTEGYVPITTTKPITISLPTGASLIPRPSTTPVPVNPGNIEGGNPGLGITTDEPKNSASRIVLEYFRVIYFALYCGQYKYNSLLRRLY